MRSYRPLTQSAATESPEEDKIFDEKNETGPVVKKTLKVHRTTSSKPNHPMTETAQLIKQQDGRWLCTVLARVPQPFPRAAFLCACHGRK